MSLSLQAQESILKNDDKLDTFYIGEVIFDSLSDTLQQPENRQERNFAKDDCGSICSDGVNSHDGTKEEDNEGERRVPNSPVFNDEPYGFKRMKQRHDAGMQIQRFWRVYKARAQTTDLVSYMVTIDEKIGGFSATTVQTQWRKYAASKRYGMFLRAVIALQSLARKLLQHKIAMRDEHRNRASTRIQSISRGYIARSQYNLEEIVHQIILCQSVARRFIAIVTLYRLYYLRCLLQVISARKIQRAYRNYKNGTTLTRRLLNQHRQKYGDYGEADIEDSLVYVIDNDEMDFESKCCEHSRCGLTDEVHAMLIESGRWFYDTLGDPDVETAENLITVMEMSEEAAFCCWRHSTAPSGRKRGPAEIVSNETKEMEKSSVVSIQSKWRGYTCAKKFGEMRQRRTLSV